jgi:hypothetical protein
LRIDSFRHPAIHLLTQIVMSRNYANAKRQVNREGATGLLCDLWSFPCLFFFAFSIVTSRFAVGWVIGALLQRRMRTQKLIPAENQGIE